MSNTIMLQGVAPSNGRKKESDISLRFLRTPTPNGSQPRMASTSSSKTTQNGRAVVSPTSTTPKKTISQAETWLLKEKAARLAMTPLDEKNPQRCPLGRAIAMQAATSPTISSFPDSFWNPFLEQDEYDREKRSASSRRYREDSRSAIKATNIRTSTASSVTPRKLQFQTMKPTANARPSRKSSFGITTIFQLFVKICFYMSLGLLVSSLLDVPYFRRILEVMAFVGQLALGLALWLFVYIRNDVLPFLQEQYHYLQEDLNGFLTMVKALLQNG